MKLEIQVLTWDRHKKVVMLNLTLNYISVNQSSNDLWINLMHFNFYPYKVQDYDSVLLTTNTAHPIICEG